MSVDIGTTSLDKLPTTNEINETPNNIVQQPNINSNNLQLSNNQLSNNQLSNNQLNNNELDINRFVNDIQKASSSGVLNLPSRDIPQQTIQMQQDFQTKADYVPDNKTNDYIGNILDKEQILLEQKQKLNQSDNFDYIYQTIQLPLLVGIIYFLFQLPFIRKNLLTFLPNLFNKDGAPKLSGYIFNSVMFALLYTLIVKGINYLQ